MHLIKKSDISKNKKITYVRFCSDIRPQKSETQQEVTGLTMKAKLALIQLD
jgi:hypothetical protein